MLPSPGYKDEYDAGLDVCLMALNCGPAKTTLRSNKTLPVGASFEHAGCYIFVREATENAMGQIYVGQTRYFDSRFNGYGRVDDYANGWVMLIHQPARPGFDEADIQHLEFLLIDHFKEQCFGSNFTIENKQSGTPSVGHSTVHTQMEAVRDLVIHHLKNTFSLSLYLSMLDTTRLQVIQAENGLSKRQRKRYRLSIERDPKTQLFRVKAGSLAVDHDHVAFWHHKQIHRRLEKTGVFGPTKRMDGRSEALNYREVKEDWVAMNLSEIAGAFANNNNPSSIPWKDVGGNDLEYAKLKLAPEGQLNE